MQRCLEASCVPKGYDHEGAFSTRWLASYGFTVFNILDEITISNTSDWRIELLKTGVLCGYGSPMITLGADVIDYCASLESSKNESIKIVIKDIRGPIFLIPFAARRSLNAESYVLEWNDPLGEVIKVIINDPKEIYISDINNLCDIEYSVDVTIRISDKAYLFDDSTKINVNYALNPKILAGTHEKCLSNGISVKRALWEKLNALANLVLVPNTEKSRSLGAGGGDAND